MKLRVSVSVLVTVSFVESIEAWRQGTADLRSAQSATHELANRQLAGVYVDEPLKNLVKRVPELKGIRSAADQENLTRILKNSGQRVDDFFADVVDLIAHEDITQERLNELGAVAASERVKDSYLILRHGESQGMRIIEYRMDANGNRKDNVGLEQGFFVTSGFALSCIHLSPAFQRNSRFRYLGDQRVSGRDTYVVAFAQLPDGDANLITLRGPHGAPIHMHVQGIAWVDRKNFQVFRMRTDLVSPQTEIGLDQATTTVKFSEVRIADVPTPLWLPREVDVYMRFRPLGVTYPSSRFQNKHHYTDYRRYRVSSKMLVPQ